MSIGECTHMQWVAEMGSSHALRIISKLSNLSIPLKHIAGSVVSLIYTPCNVADVLPIECYKHLTRVFCVPYSCSDLSWLCFSKQCSVLHQKDTIIRIQAYPKSLEDSIIDLLFDSPLVACGIHPTHYTHVLSCVYDASPGIYHFGIVSRDAYITSKMNSSELWAAVAIDKSINRQVPVCRAYYKMQELIEHYFPLWKWHSPNPHIHPIYRTAVDVGASPGGWSQYLSTVSSTVISIDPGLLKPSVSSIPNIQHVPHMLQHPNTQDILKTTPNIDICVCDINVDGVQTAQLLVESLLCHLSTSAEHPQILILTLKLPKNPSERIISAVSKQVTSILETAACCDFRVVHLNANTRNERTLVCRITTTCYVNSSGGESSITNCVGLPS